MRFYSSDIPSRMVALSILPPPPSHQPPAPFGFGALVVESRGKGEATFTSHAHGFGAGFPAERMRAEIRALFSPETAAITYREVLEQTELANGRNDRVAAPIWDMLPLMGSLSNAHLSLSHDVLQHAAGVGMLTIPGPQSTPLARLHRIGTEAQAIWIYWLFRRCPARMRRRLLASFQAWQVIETARATRDREV